MMEHIGWYVGMLFSCCQYIWGASNNAQCNCLGQFFDDESNKCEIGGITSMEAKLMFLATEMINCDKLTRTLIKTRFKNPIHH